MVIDARIADGQILTPPPKPASRINGSKIHGARPGKPFLYRIPTQGEQPMSFGVEGLPESLTLDATRGIIRGVTPRVRGDYRMTFRARNSHGEAALEFKLVVGDTLALTPPTGWNHWGGHASNIRADIIRAATDLMVNRGLADVGFQYVGIDDCWMRMSPAEHHRITSLPDEKYLVKHRGIDFENMVGEPRDAAGNILPNAYFPDLPDLVDSIHAHGLRAGIYSSPGPMTCQNLEGSHRHEQEDAQRYAAWGFDLLKYDQCTAGKLLAAAKQQDPNFHPREFWKCMPQHLAETDRDFIFNLCQYGLDEPWRWAAGIGAHTWRIGGDLNHHVKNYFQEALRVATQFREFNGPGHWNDPDFIYVGRQVQTRLNHFVESSPTALDTNQEYQYVTLWAMICAPFFFSTDVLNVSDFTIGLLANPDVMAINQDELGHTAAVVRNQDHEVVMVKNLADGSKAVAIFNRNPRDEAVIAVSGADVGIGQSQWRIYDVWRQRETGGWENEIAARLSPNGVGLFIIR